MQVTVEQIEKKVKQLSVEDLRRVLKLIDSLLETKEAKQTLTKERFIRLQENIENLEKTLTLKGTVKKNNDLYTFIPENDSLKWKIKDKEVNLHDTYRYLTIVENTGKLGWARIVKTRITQYHDAVKLNIPLIFNGKEYNVTFKANWDAKTLSDYNLEIELTSDNSPRLACKILAWFDLSNLEIVEIKVLPQYPFGELMIDATLPPIADDTFEEIKLWIEKNENIFKKDLVIKLLTPFKYEKNLVGKDAINFLGYEKECELKIGNIQNHNILVFNILNFYTSYAIFI